MKRALITDTHFGIKKNNQDFLNSQIKFFKTEFIPYLKQNQISDIDILGDLFDTRVAVNTMIMNSVIYLFEEMRDFNITIFPGNHDSYYFTSTDIHSLQFLKKYKNVEVIEKITSKKFGDKSITYIPWQTNLDEFQSLLERDNIKGDVCLCHMDIASFSMNKYQLSHDGISPTVLFDRFKRTFSGHYHTRSIKKQLENDIVYVGAPYQLTRNDLGEERGFCILDLDDLSYQFINNTSSIKFIAINYQQEINENLIVGNIIDVLVEYNQSYDALQLEKYIKEVEKYKPLGNVNVKVLNNFLSENEVKEFDIYKIKTIPELIEEYLMLSEIEEKDQIRKIMNELYEETKEVVV